MVATFRMSTSVIVGFEGDSIQISLVALGRMSSAMEISMLGEKVTATPCAAATLVKYR